MRIRIEGGRAELDTALDALRQALDVRSVSRPYPGRDLSTRRRIYLDARVRQPETTDPTTDHRQNKADTP
ncbi:hypothetical protein [Parafrankia sp. EUN1f]|uniref:hypothetical protein n=1 Tax=Parafrankia sp. EUN1f TaxID=102897 RepID=UPI0001C4524D|nr:hypothetical protein [Parafrankia sp. EUN1f]EFC79178.1 hypothetical protein FrEUN1fDRAFT_7709 [Parafrankia sp. EUN1f]